MSFRRSYNRRGYTNFRYDSSPSHGTEQTQQIHFSSIEEMIRACTESVERYGIHKEKEGGVTRSDFIGRQFSCWNDVIQAANAAWQEGLDKVEWMLWEIEKHAHELPKPKDRRRKRHFSEDRGDEIDNDRLRAGQSDFWVETSRQETHAPQRVVIITNIAARGDYDWQNILWRGVAAIVLTDLFEKTGYRAELYGVSYNRDLYDGDYGFLSCCMKDAQSPLDISAITNGLSGWFYRTAWFQAKYTHPTIKPWEYMGYHADLNKDVPEVQELAGQGAKVVCIDGVFSESAALALVKRVIEELNAGV